MSVSDQTRKSLEKVGLTGYEIKTFTSLIKTGELTASDLSQQCGVAYSRIYDVLAELEKKGWVGSDKSRPTKYFAKSPNSALQTTKQRVEEDFAKNQKIILNDLNPIYKKSGTAERPDIWVLTGTMNIATRILEMIDTCREEVLIAIPKAGEELVKQALIALKYIYRKSYKYQKAGIIFSGLNDVDVYKKNLFSSINSEEKRKRLMKAIDYTNIKYGRHALSIAQAGLKKKWNIKKQHSSKIDTACFDFLPVIGVS